MKLLTSILVLGLMAGGVVSCKDSGGGTKGDMGVIGGGKGGASGTDSGAGGAGMGGGSGAEAGAGGAVGTVDAGDAAGSTDGADAGPTQVTPTAATNLAIINATTTATGQTVVGGDTSAYPACQ